MQNNKLRQITMIDKVIIILTKKLYSNITKVRHKQNSTKAKKKPHSHIDEINNIFLYQQA